jgi:hypothetical protein
VRVGSFASRSLRVIGTPPCCRSEPCCACHAPAFALACSLINAGPDSPTHGWCGTPPRHLTRPPPHRSPRPPREHQLYHPARRFRVPSPIPHSPPAAAAARHGRRRVGHRRPRGGLAHAGRAARHARPRRGGRRCQGVPERGREDVPRVRGRGRGAGGRAALRGVRRVRLPRLPALLRVRAQRRHAVLPAVQHPLQAPQRSVVSWHAS